jgi:hypothetical protein
MLPNTMMAQHGQLVGIWEHQDTYLAGAGTQTAGLAFGGNNPIEYN